MAQDKFIELDLTHTLWREYIFKDASYCINKPVALFIKKDTGSHRVVDSNGLTHYIDMKKVIAIKWCSKDESVRY